MLHLLRLEVLFLLLLLFGVFVTLDSGDGTPRPSAHGARQPGDSPLAGNATKGLDKVI